MRANKIITSETDTLADYLLKIWQFRSLIGTFAWRDIKIKYAQTLLGVGMEHFAAHRGLFWCTRYFFTFVVKFLFGETHYILFVLSGLALWSLFGYIFWAGHVRAAEQP